MKTITLATAMLLGMASAQAFAQTYTRTEETQYHDNTASWVLGQVERTLVDGLEESKTTFNAAAQPTTTSAFGKLRQTYGWDTQGNLASVSDGRDAASYNTTVQYSDWKRGIPQSIGFPDGYTRKATVDDDGWIRAVTDENAYVTCYEYDAMGRLTQVRYPSDVLNAQGKEQCGTDRWNAVERSFTNPGTAKNGLPAGHWREEITTGTAKTFVYYDAFWRPVLKETYDTANKDGTLSQTLTRYDAGGNQVFQSYPTNAITDVNQSLPGMRTTYDSLDRPTRVEQDAEAVLGGIVATTTAYLDNFSTQVTNPRRKVTTTTFKTFDQPSTDWPVKVTAPEGAVTDIDRDAFGKPKSIKRRDAGNTVQVTRAYTYNTAQELCLALEPETGSTYMGYDAAGNLEWSASGYAPGASCVAKTAVGARRSDRLYDNRNRLVDLSFADDTGEQVWTYTPDGQPDTITTYNGAGRTGPYINKYAYNKRRMVGGQGETGQDGEDATAWYTWSIGYGYDRNGALANNVYPSGQVVDYAPNALGQATKAGTYATGVSYYPNGGLWKFTYGNGVMHEMTQNARQLPERSRDYYGSTSFLDDSYDYDENGNVVAISDGVAGNRGDRDMTYDDLDRLTSTASPMYGGTISYTYDVLDNLQSVARPNGQSYRYCYNTAWQLEFLRVGATTACNAGSAAFALSYDPQGNLYQKNAQRYVFTQDNRLRNVTGVEYYRYDGHGRRTLSYLPARGNTFSLYGTDGVLRYMKDDSQSRQEEYVYLAGSLVAIRETVGTTTSIKYQHTDALGSPAAVTDAARVVVERSEREPYGKLLNRAVHNGPGFTGHAEDAATGLTYMQQRYYDSGVGSFLSADPVTALEGGQSHFNRYAYAYDNPYAFTDPDGRCPICIAVVLLYFVVGPANAPAPGEQTRSMPVDEQIISAIPGGGRAVQAGKFGVRQASRLTQRAATREAKRQAKIPTSQQPTSQTNGRAPDGTAVGRQQSYEVPAAGGGTEIKSVQVSRDTVGAHAGQTQIEAGTVKATGQTDTAGRPRIQNTGKVRVDFDKD